MPLYQYTGLYLTHKQKQETKNEYVLLNFLGTFSSIQHFKLTETAGCTKVTRDIRGRAWSRIRTQNFPTGNDRRRAQ